MLCLGAAQSFELCQVDSLFAHLHFFIKSALFGQVADAHHVSWGKGMAVEGYFALVGCSNAVNDANERGFAGSVGTQQAKHFAARHLNAHVVQGCMLGIAFHNV